MGHNFGRILERVVPLSFLLEALQSAPNGDVVDLQTTGASSTGPFGRGVLVRHEQMLHAFAVGFCIRAQGRKVLAYDRQNNFVEIEPVNAMQVMMPRWPKNSKKAPIAEDMDSEEL